MPYDRAHPQLWWRMVPGGSIWHAFKEGAPVEMLDGHPKRRTLCGVLRSLTGSDWFGHDPPGRTCDDCRMLWNEHYGNWSAT